MIRRTCLSSSHPGQSAKHIAAASPAHDQISDEKRESLQRNTSSDLLTPAQTCSRLGASELRTAHTPIGESSMSSAHPRRSIRSQRSGSYGATLAVRDILDATKRPPHIPLPAHPGRVPRRQGSLPLVRQVFTASHDRPPHPRRADGSAQRPEPDGCRELGRRLRLMQRPARSDADQRKASPTTSPTCGRIQLHSEPIPGLVTPSVSPTNDLDPETRRRDLCSVTTPQHFQSRFFGGDIPDPVHSRAIPPRD